MENPDATPQRRRRSNRYQQEHTPTPVHPPAAPESPFYDSREPQPYQRVPRSARNTSAAPAAQPQQPVYPPRPRVLRQQAAPADPTPFDAAPPVMARPQRAKPAPAKKTAFRMPVWITASIIGLMVAVLALTAAQNLMAAYLKQQQDAREAAFQAILDDHPIYYQDLIERYAAEYNLRPAFMTAIIMNESSFRTDAMSGVGARGLMQLMPDTAEWIAGKLDVENYHFDRMFDAESNIRFGAWYLNYLSKLFRGDPVLVACAYHTGQSKVASWLSDRSISPDGLTIPLDQLPDGPTKTYAGRVTEDYGIYDALYFHVFNEPTPSDGGADTADIPVSVFAGR